MRCEIEPWCWRTGAQARERGAVVDEFLGVQPESRVRVLLEQHVSRESDDGRARARTLREQGKLTQARAVLDQARAGDPENQRLIPDLANVLIDLGEFDQARNVLGSAPGGAAFDGEMRKAMARLAFAEVAATSPSAEELSQAIESDPHDCESRYRLGALHIVRGEYEAALEQFIELLRVDRAFRDDAGRKALLSVFEMLASDHPLVGRYRARMSSLLH